MVELRLAAPRTQSPVDSKPFQTWAFPDGTLWAEFYRENGGYLLRFPHLADFRVSTAQLEVTGIPAPGVPEATSEHLYLNQVLPLVLSMQRTQDDEYLFDHCVNVALIGIATATQLGMRHDQVMEVGLGALLQDIGMLCVPKDIRLAARPLSKDEWLEIQRQPYHTLDALEKIRGFPAAVGYVGYQIHEQPDASGYPRQRTGMYVHPYAKIVAVAACDM